uniref:Uncharacterized protein n=1 Tax=Arundo donax TaxID=35708 RepID=A0A0A9F7L6_ARUDO
MTPALRMTLGKIPTLSLEGKRKMLRMTRQQQTALMILFLK